MFPQMLQQNHVSKLTQLHATTAEANVTRARLVDLEVEPHS